VIHKKVFYPNSGACQASCRLCCSLF
jgi:hypothetical protein